MVILKVFHGHDIKRFEMKKREELAFTSLIDLLRSDFKTISEDHCFKYFDSEGDLCTLTEATFEDCFSAAFSSIEGRAAREKGKQEERPSEHQGEVTQESEGKAHTIRLFSCEKVAVPTCERETLMSQIQLVMSGREVSPAVKQLRGQVQRGGLQETHPGITCDCCDMSPITGPRYKCEECGDFDLCQACYESPMSPSILEHVSNHEFKQMSSLDTMRGRRTRGGGIRIPLHTEIIESERLPTVLPQEPQTALSPRTGSEWTEVQIGAPHVEGLLRAFGVDVDKAKEAVSKFISTGDFRDIMEHIGGSRNREQGVEAETSTGG
jgi:hypothetical protein